MRFYFLLAKLAVLAPMVLMTSCNSQLPDLAQVPLTTNYKLTTQKKMQALQHWKELADKIAVQIKEEVKTGKHANKGIYVSPAGTTEFEKNFRTLLISALIKQNLKVTNNQGQHMILIFNIDMVKHGKREKQTAKGFYRTPAPKPVNRPSGKNPPLSLATVESGKYSSDTPLSEILIATSLKNNGDYIFHDTSIYYINDTEWNQYAEEERNTTPTNQYEMVNE